MDLLLCSTVKVFAIFAFGECQIVWPTCFALWVHLSSISVFIRATLLMSTWYGHTAHY